MSYQEKKIFYTSLTFLSLDINVNWPQKVPGTEKPRMSITEDADGLQVYNAVIKEFKANNFVEIETSQSRAVFTMKKLSPH